MGSEPRPPLQPSAGRVVGGGLLRGRAGEAGNTLVLFPAAILIVLGLGAVAIDSATLFLGQRRLADLSAAIANDAAAGIDLDAFYRAEEGLRLDAERGALRAEQLRAGQTQDRAFEEVTCTVAVEGERATVTCTGFVRPILAPFWPMAERRRLSASESAELRPTSQPAGAVGRAGVTRHASPRRQTQ